MFNNKTNGCTRTGQEYESATSPTRGACGKRRVVTIAIALVMCVAAFFSVLGQEESQATGSEITVDSALGLVNAVKNANDGDVIKIDADLIELDERLDIEKKITLTTERGTVIKPSASLEPIGDKKNQNNSMIYINGVTASGALTIGTEVTSEASKTLTLDGGGKMRVIFNGVQGKEPYDSLVINSGKITNGMSTKEHGQAGGIFNTHNARFIMNGGEVTGNSIHPEAKDKFGNTFVDVAIKYCKDVWNGSGTQTIINGGKIGWMLQNKNGLHSGGDTTMNGGTVDAAYIVCSGSGYHSGSFTYNGGTVGELKLSDSSNNGSNLSTYKDAKVKTLVSGTKYIAGSFVAKVGDYGYMTNEEAQAAVDNGEGSLETMDRVVIYTLNANGGSSNYDFVVFKAGSTINENGLPKSSDVKKERNMFLGWYTESGTALIGQTVVNDSVAYAKWEPTEFLITLDANGGMIDQTTLTVIAGESIGSIPEVTYNGHTFKGWFTENGDKITSETQVTSDMTIKADWEKAVIIDDSYQSGLNLPGTNDNSGSEEPGFTIPIIVAVIGVLEIVGFAVLNRFF